MERLGPAFRGFSGALGEPTASWPFAREICICNGRRTRNPVLVNRIQSLNCDRESRFVSLVAWRYFGHERPPFH